MADDPVELDCDMWEEAAAERFLRCFRMVTDAATAIHDAFMHVLLVAPMVAPIDQASPQLGGAQVLLADLASELVRRGHRVTLAAPAGSAVAGVEMLSLDVGESRLKPARFDGTPQDDVEDQATIFAAVASWVDCQADPPDVVHAHAYDAPAFSTLRNLPSPVIHTLHLPPLHREVVQAARKAREATLVSVTEANAELWRGAGVLVRTVVPNGIAVADIPFRESPEDFLLFAGRITPEKGTDHAIRAAATAGRRLLLVGDAYDRDYYETEIRPLVREVFEWQPGSAILPGATYIGPRSRGAVLELMSHATALLMPVCWDEPFGLAAIEAQAAGCPVLAYERGGLPSVVRHAETGWLVSPGDEYGLTAGVDWAGKVDRGRCRAWVAERFSLDTTVSAYESIYREAA